MFEFMYDQSGLQKAVAIVVGVALVGMAFGLIWLLGSLITCRRVAYGKSANGWRHICPDLLLDILASNCPCISLILWTPSYPLMRGA